MLFSLKLLMMIMMMMMITIIMILLLLLLCRHGCGALKLRRAPDLKRSRVRGLCLGVSNFIFE